MRLYRNLSAAFERSVEAARPVREIDVTLKVALDDASIKVYAETEDGRTASETLSGLDPAQNAARALQAVRDQLSKRSGIYSFAVTSLDAPSGVPFLPASALNSLRRSLADTLDGMSFLAVNASFPAPTGNLHQSPLAAPVTLSYKYNLANPLSRALYASRGAVEMEDAYELTHRPGVELMRSRYCVRYELGLCPRSSSSGTTSPSSSGLSRGSQPLFLVNNGRRLRLRFHCPTCEMTVEDC